MQQKPSSEHCYIPFELYLIYSCIGQTTQVLWCTTNHPTACWSIPSIWQKEGSHCLFTLLKEVHLKNFLFYP